MMMKSRVMCVLAVVLCCACGYTMAAAAAGPMEPSNDVVTLPAVIIEEQPKKFNTTGMFGWDDFLINASIKHMCKHNPNTIVDGVKCSARGFPEKSSNVANHDRGSTSQNQEQGQRDTTKEQQGSNREEAAGSLIPNPPGGVTPPKDPVLVEKPQNGMDDSKGINPPSASEDERRKQETEARDGATTTQGQPPESTAATQSTEEASSNSSDNTTPADSNLTQQSPEAAGATAISGSEETNSTTPPSPESNITDTPPTTPSPVPNAEINTIASTVQKNKGNVDRSVSPVWMRTAAPLLIMAVLVTTTMY
ncbi:uncharacterized protein TM35_000531110 [Trypanosoma theileri]|uniref:Mucin-associated surface protein (MASP) n=1 Tax=Trypanosoma theileri TaxID=67003 RepID=A0A1X0NH14_9TRYP|nr:uncharacterized protein TM35_000531110 [Trypanosoma theileri]ORC83927.1 hypothetical protein TM35_000531110 [Trypanosoma theileri]